MAAVWDLCPPEWSTLQRALALALAVSMPAFPSPASSYPFTPAVCDTLPEEMNSLSISPADRMEQDAGTPLAELQRADSLADTRRFCPSPTHNQPLPPHPASLLQLPRTCQPLRGVAVKQNPMTQRHAHLKHSVPASRRDSPGIISTCCVSCLRWVPLRSTLPALLPMRPASAPATDTATAA